MKGFTNWMVVSMLSLNLMACDTTPNYAPVSDITPIERIPQSGKHQVKKGETLYEVAWRYGLDYRYVANQNQFAEPYAIKPGQVLYLRKQKKFAEPIRKVKPVVAIKPKNKMLVMDENPTITNWIWPAKGKVITSFSVSHKGINIAGQLGESVLAVAPGKVVYAGDGLRGYGNLIIIKHNNLFLSAYAHNSLILIKEGEWVKQGQKIAEMGRTGTDKVMLHFEIRRAGKPIDPVSLYH